MREYQKGVTLIELMVSVAVGLIVAAMMFGIYANSAVKSSELLKTSKLNQELYSLMLVMGNDIRRAGYWGNPDYENPQDNPFSQDDNTGLGVIDDLVSNTRVAANSAAGGECILYAFDADEDGLLDDTDIFGFRLNNGIVQMREKGDASETVNDDCSKGSWRNVTDVDQFLVEELNFSLARTQCINADEPNDTDDDSNGVIDDEDSDCYANVPTDGSGVITVETRQVTISMTASLVSDANVKSSIKEDVRVRNDMVRIR